jgi:hypothetical protein
MSVSASATVAATAATASATVATASTPTTAFAPTAVATAASDSATPTPTAVAPASATTPDVITELVASCPDGLKTPLNGSSYADGDADAWDLPMLQYEERVYEHVYNRRQAAEDDESDAVVAYLSAMVVAGPGHVRALCRFTSMADAFDGVRMVAVLLRCGLWAAATQVITHHPPSFALHWRNSHALLYLILKAL